MDRARALRVLIQVTELTSVLSSEESMYVSKVFNYTFKLPQ